MEKVTLRGALHMHTHLSHDGRMSLAELVMFLKGKGYDYIAISEHSYDVDNESMNKLVERAAELSSEDFIIIPGIEFRCHGWTDILGYGVVKSCDSEDPVTVIKHIHDHGGVAVLAHPNVRQIPIDPKWVSMLDGCEIWNVTNDGKYLPLAGGIRKFQELAADSPNLLAFSGLDLHQPGSYCSLFTETKVTHRDRDSILKALKAGHFRSVSPLFSVGSQGAISAMTRFKLGAFRIPLNLARWIRGPGD